MSNGESCSHWKHEKGNSKQNHYKETETIQLGSGRYGHYKFAYTKETRQVEYKSQQARQEIPMDTVHCCDLTTLNNPTIWKIFVKGLGFNNIVSE